MYIYNVYVCIYIKLFKLLFQLQKDQIVFLWKSMWNNNMIINDKLGHCKVFITYIKTRKEWKFIFMHFQQKKIGFFFFLQNISENSILGNKIKMIIYNWTCLIEYNIIIYIHINIVPSLM